MTPHPDLDEHPRFGPRLAHIEGQVAGLTAQVQHLSSSLQNIASKMDMFLERSSKKEPLNWGWLVSGILLLGLIITLYTTPLSEQNGRQDATLFAHQQELRSLLTEQAGTHAGIIARLEAVELEAARNYGLSVQLQALKEQINLIDQQGSRRWIGKESPQK